MNLVNRFTSSLTTLSTTNISSTSPLSNLPLGPDLNIRLAFRDYVVKMLTITKEMKVLIIDSETLTMLSLCFTVSELLNYQVYLTEKIEKIISEQSSNKSTIYESSDSDSYSFHITPHNSSSSSSSSIHMPHLTAIILVRPSIRNVEAIKKLIQSKRYKYYYLFFTNLLPEQHLSSLALADSTFSIQHIQEFYTDMYCSEPHLFHCNIKSYRSMHQQTSLSRPSPTISFSMQLSSHLLPNYQRNLDCILAMLLSLKKRPEVRYCKQSYVAEGLARDVVRRMNEYYDLFTFHSTPGDNPLLLIVDRRDDPITPLLTPWTYQAMTHELLNIQHNRLSLQHIPDIRDDLRDVVLCSESDHFYRGSQFLNFGDLGVSIKDLVSDYQRKTQNHSKLDSIESMQKFIDNYPEFRALSGTVSKHVSIVTELSRVVNQRQLLNISECEQELICNSDHADSVRRINELLTTPSIDFYDLLRVVMLYAIKYEGQTGSQLDRWKSTLYDMAIKNGIAPSVVHIIDDLILYAGRNVRGGNLFGTETSQSLFSRASSYLTSGLQGVENIYSQHKTLLQERMQLLMNSNSNNVAGPKAWEKDFGRVEPSRDNGPNRTIIVYMIGGVTYEEFAYMESLNKSGQVRVLLGGSCIHNSHSFLADIARDDQKAFWSKPRESTIVNTKSSKKKDKK